MMADQAGHSRGDGDYGKQVAIYSVDIAAISQLWVIIVIWEFCPVVTKLFIFLKKNPKSRLLDGISRILNICNKCKLRCNCVRQTKCNCEFDGTCKPSLLLCLICDKWENSCRLILACTPHYSLASELDCRTFWALLTHSFPIHHLLGV